MKRILIGIGALGLAVGVQAQGFVSGQTAGGGVVAPAFIVNYYQGASFSYRVGTAPSNTLQGMIGFAPGPANPAFGSLNAEQIAAFNLGANPGSRRVYVAAYVGRPGETDLNKFFKAPVTSQPETNAFYNTSASQAGYAFSATMAPRKAAGRTIDGQDLSFGEQAEVALQIRAWVSSPGTPDYNSWEEFMANVAFGAGGQAGYAGVSPIGKTVTGASGTPGILKNATTGAALVSEWFLYPVPEPSVVGLGLLGIAGLFFIRRRK